mmetsp:Transcript_22061/g.31202  ORF Transcript_22061/g.31202 Transcript_22061/m.31202 type:complete len:82 (+) Transcript_22061:68-313(+)
MQQVAMQQLADQAGERKAERVERGVQEVAQLEKGFAAVAEAVEYPVAVEAVAPEQIFSYGSQSENLSLELSSLVYEWVPEA